MGRRGETATFFNRRPVSVSPCLPVSAPRLEEFTYSILLLWRYLRPNLRLGPLRSSFRRDFRSHFRLLPWRDFRYWSSLVWRNFGNRSPSRRHFRNRLFVFVWCNFRYRSYFRSNLRNRSYLRRDLRYRPHLRTDLRCDLRLNFGSDLRLATSFLRSYFRNRTTAHFIVFH